MKDKILVLLLLAFANILHAQYEPNVLFIGNSYTQVNDLPKMVADIAQSTGERMTYSSNTPGGCTFMQHCSNQSMAMIQAGGWDIVVLQEQSQLPSFPQDQVEWQCFPYAQKLVDSIYAHNPDAEPVFYMTWGRKNGDPDTNNVAEFPVLGTYEGMDSMLCERYTYMAETYHTSLCPVGRVWRHLRTNNPDIELYANDGSHPSVAGTYAAACAFYVMFFHRTPDDITFSSNLDENIATTIRKAVKIVVFDSLEHWRRAFPHVGFDAAKTEPSITVYPHPATTQLTVRTPYTPQEITLQDIYGHTVATYSTNSMELCIDASQIPAGTYILRAKTATGIISKVIIKQP